METLTILGTGIAGLTAAIYAARANLSPLLISGPEDGGQLTLTTDVENFPGFPEGIQGPELINTCKKQAERFGARFKVDMVTEFNQIQKGFELTLMSGEKIQTKALIIATGASARWLGIPSEEKYKGRGVSTCSTCDGFLYRGKEVIVIGGGDSAMEESLFLTKFASKVTIIHRQDSFRASKIMQGKVLKHEKIKIIWDTTVEEITGDGKKVNGVKLRNIKTNTITDFKCDGVFLAIGHVPNTSFLNGKLERDEVGYLKTRNYVFTTIPGVFAAGDVADRRFRQAITAAGSGCMAAMEAEKWLAGQGE